MTSRRAVGIGRGVVLAGIVLGLAGCASSGPRAASPTVVCDVAEEDLVALVCPSPFDIPDPVTYGELTQIAQIDRHGLRQCAATVQELVEIVRACRDAGQSLQRWQTDSN